MIINGKRLYISIRCLICDSPAAAYILGIKQHNAYFSCRKCTVQGEWKNKVVFLSENEQMRTDQSFRNRLQIAHHNNFSPFEDLEDFNMIDQVPLDYLHLVLLGTTKKLLQLWVSTKSKPKVNIIQLQKLCSNFMGLNPWIPKDFARKGHPLLELGRWKATTFRLFLLYAGLIILEGVLPEEYIQHFNVLSCAIRILSHPIYYKTYNSYAHDLLVYFVQQFKTLYGEQYVSWNMHSIIHLAKDAEMHGPLDFFSAFPYENFMQTIKRMLRKKGMYLQQIHRRLVEKSSLKIKKNNNEVNYPILLHPVIKKLPDGCYHCHKTLKFLNFELKDSRPNNTFVTVNDEIVLIDRICKQNDNIVVIGREFLKKEDLPNYPMRSTQMGISIVSNLSTAKIYAVKDIRNKACLFFHDEKTVCIPLLHH